MGFFSSLGTYFGGPIGGMLGGGLDTTIHTNKKSGHPSGGSAPSNLFSGMLINSISNAKKDLKDFGLGNALGTAITYKSNRDKQKQIISNNNRNEIIAAENASRPVTTTQEVDFEGTVKSARAAGFNPLTALRATGGNISSTTTRYVAPLLSSMPSRNFLDVMSDAFTGYQSFQRGRTQKLQFYLETELLKSQIAKNYQSLNQPARFSPDGTKRESAYVDTVYPDGTVARILNPELYEMGIMEFIMGSAQQVVSTVGDLSGVDSSSPTQIFEDGKKVVTKSSTALERFINGWNGGKWFFPENDARKAPILKPKLGDIKKSYFHTYKVDPRVNWIKEIGDLFDKK